MKVAVEAAIEELRTGLPGHDIEVLEDPDGGAYVVIPDVQIGEAFTPSLTWVGFQITWACPDPDVYPHFIDPGIQYVGSGTAPNQHLDGNLPTSMTRGATMPGFDRAAIQISRKSSRRDASTDTALTKLLRIIDFLRSR